MPGYLQKTATGYKIIIELGIDPITKKRKRMTRAFVGKEKAALAEMTRLLKELDAGVAVDDTSSVKEYLDQWLSTYAKPKLAVKTYRSYEQLLMTHVCPYVGKHQLSKLRPIHLQQLYNHLLIEGRKDGKEGGLSRRSVEYIHRVMHKALDTAVKWQLLSRNVAEGVELPPKEANNDVHALDETQVQAMLDAATSTPHYTAIFLTVATGMRRGEVYGLRWSDMDLAEGIIAVRQTIQYTPEDGVYFKAPKTTRSARTVVVSQSVIDVMRAHRQSQLAQRLKMGPDWLDNDLVFCQENGQPTHPDTITKWFPLFMKRIGLPGFRFHDLRHTHATLLLAKGVDFKVISDRLGHAGIKITLDTYTHVLPEQQKKAANKLEDLLRPSTGV